MNDVAQRYLYAFRNDEEFAGGLAYRKAMGQIKLDGTMESLGRVDYLLDQIRRRKAPHYGEFMMEQSNENFMYLLSFYIGETVAANSGAHADWLEWEEVTQGRLQMEIAWPRQFETSVFCRLTKPDGSRKDLLPLVPIILRLFEGDGEKEKGVQVSASAFL